MQFELEENELAILKERAISPEQYWSEGKKLSNEESAGQTIFRFFLHQVNS